MREIDDVDNIISKILQVKGIFRVTFLSPSQREKVLELESEAENKVFNGRIPGFNAGIREALKMRYVFAALTDKELVWPDRIIEVRCGDVKVGDLIEDPADVSRFREAGEIVLGNIVIYKKIYRRADKSKLRLVFLPFQLEGLSLKGWKVVAGTPSPPVDLYLKGVMQFKDTERVDIGTVVIGMEKALEGES